TGTFTEDDSTSTSSTTSVTDPDGHTTTFSFSNSSSTHEEGNLALPGAGAQGEPPAGADFFPVALALVCCIDPVMMPSPAEIRRQYEEAGKKIMDTKEGKWNAAYFFVTALMGEWQKSPTGVMGRILWILEKGEHSDEAATFAKGCFGLVELRIGKDVY